MSDAALTVPSPPAGSGEPPAGMLIRELARSDRPAVAFAFAHLGARSRYLRFLTDKRTLGEHELDAMCAIDQWHHGGVIAFSPPPRGPIGLARYVRLADFDTAEVAVEVVDAWQRCGVGRALLWQLRKRALHAGVRRFHATMLRENRGAVILACRIGRVTTLSSDGPEREAMIELSERHP
jgi:GNAT superfamily N-acetyltransferase